MKRAMLVGAMLTLSACQKEKTKSSAAPPISAADRAKSIDGPRVKGVGVSMFLGQASDLMVSADGLVGSVLIDGVKPSVSGVPPPMRIGRAFVFGMGDGAVGSVEVGKGVVNTPGGRLFSVDGKYFLFLANYSPAALAGDLNVVSTDNAKGGPSAVGRNVSYYGVSADSKRLAFVSDGVLRVGMLPNGPFREVAGEVAAAQFSPDNGTVYFRRRLAAAGGLFAVTLSDEKATPKKVVDQVGDFAFSADGKWLAYVARETAQARSLDLFVADTVTLKSKRVADRVIKFAFSPDSQWLARLEGDSPDQPGQLFLGKGSGDTGVALGKDVREFAFSSDSKRLAYRAKFREVQLVGVQTERLGELYLLELPSVTPKLLVKDCPNFSFSPDGQALAYTATVFTPMYTRKLMLLSPGATEAKNLKEWLYEYVFSADSSRLYFRADCVREGRSCAMLSVDVKRPESAPKVEAEKVYRFGLSRNGERAWVSYVHATDTSSDVSVVNLKTGVKTLVDQYVKTPFEFVGPEGKALTYVVEEKGRAGVYVGRALP